MIENVCETIDLPLFLKYICTWMYRQQESMHVNSFSLCLYAYMDVYSEREQCTCIYVHTERSGEKSVKAYPHINIYYIHFAYMSAFAQ